MRPRDSLFCAISRRGHPLPAFPGKRDGVRYCGGCGRSPFLRRLRRGQLLSFVLDGRTLGRRGWGIVPRRRTTLTPRRPWRSQLPPLPPPCRSAPPAATATPLCLGRTDSGWVGQGGSSPPLRNFSSELPSAKPPAPSPVAANGATVRDILPCCPGRRNGTPLCPEQMDPEQTRRAGGSSLVATQLFFRTTLGGATCS